MKVFIFTTVKVHALFSYTFTGYELCRSNRSCAFFGAWLRLRTFYFRKEYENMRAKKFSAVATAVALLISLTACTGTGNEQASSADKSTSDIIDSATSSVDEHTSTESVEETSSGNDNANDESTITESSETSVADTTSSIPMQEEKIEERDVYDEDGNVVDKIKVKVVDGVTYTVGEKSDDKCILDGVPLFTNDPEFPSGDIITMTQIAICRRGFNISQQEIFENMLNTIRLMNGMRKMALAMVQCLAVSI